MRRATPTEPEAPSAPAAQAEEANKPYTRLAKRRQSQKLAAPPADDRKIPTWAEQRARLIRLPGGAEVIKLAGTLHGTSEELALEAARLSNSVFPHQHQVSTSATLHWYER